MTTEAEGKIDAEIERIADEVRADLKAKRDRLALLRYEVEELADTLAGDERAIRAHEWWKLPILAEEDVELLCEHDPDNLLASWD